MIIVWGSVQTDSDSREEILAASLAHVARSRLEPGCISHNVSIDAEDENRLAFYEEWEDLGALQRHFKVRESIAFAAKLVELAIRPPELRVFDSERIR